MDRCRIYQKQICQINATTIFQLHSITDASVGELCRNAMAQMVFQSHQKTFAWIRNVRLIAVSSIASVVATGAGRKNSS